MIAPGEGDVWEAVDEEDDGLLLALGGDVEVVWEGLSVHGSIEEMMDGEGSLTPTPALYCGVAMSDPAVVRRELVHAFASHVVR